MLRPRVLVLTLCLLAASFGCGNGSSTLSAAPSPGGAAAGKPPALSKAEAHFTEGFDDGALLKRGWYDGERFSIVGKEPVAGAGCVEYGWKQGATTPHTTSVSRRLFTPGESVYLRFSLRLSPGWGWSGRNYHPHLIQFMTTENGQYDGPAATHLTLYVEPVEGRLRLAAQDIQNKDAPHGLTQGPLRGGYNGKTYDSKDVLFTDDKWHRIEAEFVLNSLDPQGKRPKEDGVLRGWFDGKLVIEETNVVFRSTDFPKMKINQLLLAPYFGDGLLPHEQTLWIDELAVGERPPAPASKG